MHALALQAQLLFLQAAPVTGALDLERLLNTLLGGGPFGLLAGIFWYLYTKEKDELRALRASTNAEVAAVRAAGEAAARAERALADELRAELAQTMRENAEQQRELLEQITDLREAQAHRERAALRTVEDFAKAQVEAVEDLKNIAVALRRAYEHRNSGR